MQVIYWFIYIQSPYLHGLKNYIHMTTLIAMLYIAINVHEDAYM